MSSSRCSSRDAATAHRKRPAADFVASPCVMRSFSSTEDAVERVQIVVIELTRSRAPGPHGPSPPRMHRPQLLPHLRSARARASDGPTVSSVTSDNTVRSSRGSVFIAISPGFAGGRSERYPASAITTATAKGRASRRSNPHPERSSSSSCSAPAASTALIGPHRRLALRDPERFVARYGGFAQGRRHAGERRQRRRTALARREVAFDLRADVRLEGAVGVVDQRTSQRRQRQARDHRSDVNHSRNLMTAW